MTRKLHRRGFLQTAAASVAVAPAWGSWSRRVLGANEDLRVAVVGLNGRGKSLVNDFRRVPGTRVVALCDVDRKVLAAATKEFTQRLENVAAYGDVRRLLEAEGIDAVAIATPNHWHSLLGIWACQAGKDVYVEKPVSHNVWEGRQLVRAARKHGRIVQCGTQSRSSTGLQQAMAFLHAGQLGKVRVARGFCYKPRGSIGKVQQATVVPEHIDYDLWCGPAPKEPLQRKSLHYDWHWVWPTGNGDLGNQGIHQMDLARWALGVDRLSDSVLSIGGRLGYDDDGTTPNTLVTVHTFAGVEAPLIFEVRGLPREQGHKEMDRYRGVAIGVVVDCEKGSLVIGDYSSAMALAPDGEVIEQWKGGGDHAANFVDAMKSRKPSDLNAEIEEGHLSSALCHTGNLSYLLGRGASVGDVRKAVEKSEPGAESVERLVQHLRANGVPLEGEELTMGARLAMDGGKETCTGERAEAANELLSREYREGFVVSAVE